MQNNRFHIGERFGQEYWTNMAVDHVNGKLPNNELLAMTNEELEKYAKNDDGSIRSEMYHPPSDATDRSKQGLGSEKYVGVHRAVVILQYRNASPANTDDFFDGTVEELAESNQNNFKGLLEGLREYCRKNPDAHTARALYEKKLKVYKQKYNV